MFKNVYGKIGNMRKDVDWTVYEGVDTDGNVTIQSNARIAAINLKTGQGVLSKACPSGAYFMHLNSYMGAKPVCVLETTVLGDLRTLFEGK